MQKIIIFCACLLLGSGFIYGQDPVCEVPAHYADSLIGVYPGPYHPELFPFGGITDNAYKDEYFELQLNAVISDSITFEGVQWKMDYLQVEDNGVLNLPAGYEYACNPPDCKFLANTLGCLLISGVTGDTGVYDLKLKSEISVLNGVFKIKDTLPELLIPGSHYYLSVINYTFDVFKNQIGYKVLSNPVVDRIQLEFNLDSRTDYRIDLIDINGFKLKSVNRTSYGIVNESIDLGAEIAPGYYFVRLTTDKGIATEKILILPR
jgi:hypothetical protein